MKHYIVLIVILFTTWFKTFAETPRGEYPRPQFERKDWVSLNGEWTYQLDPVGSGFENGYTKSNGFNKKIIVPFAPETILSGVEHKDFIPQIWYQRTIKIPERWMGKKVLINFGAVYYDSEVYLDSVFVGRHFGGSSSFSYDLTKLVKPGKEHSLVVVASSDVRSAKQSAGKQSLQRHSYFCSYTRTTGIWQTVWLEAVHPNAVKSASIVTDIDQNNIVVTPFFYNESNYRFRILLKDKGKVINKAEISATNSSKAILSVKNPKLWSPESPFLYEILYQVLDESGKMVDEVSSYCGMRKIHIVGNKILLNNEPYYQRLVLDQGFYAEGSWTAPSDEALKNDILLGKKAGFNGARLHQKVFEERYYYWADKLGYITWGEAPSWGMDANDVEVARNYIAEWTECVTRDRNHPSLLVWTPFNEEWWPDKKQYPRFVEDIYRLTKTIDPTRPVNTSSGGEHIITDIWTVHSYEQNPLKLKDLLYKDGKFYQTPHRTQVGTTNIGFNYTQDNVSFNFPKYEGDRPYLIDEFGGIKWVKNRERQQVNSSTESWGYGDAPKTEEEFYTRLEQQVDALLSLSEHVWGYCYTQLTDVEQEQNGIYFYDRSSKFDMERIQKIFSKKPQLSRNVK